MSRVALLTGADGFIGRHAAAELRRRGYRLRLSSRRDCDLRDAESIRRLVRRTQPALVVHAAGCTGAPDWNGFWDAHVSATVNLLSALTRGTRVVVTGSCAEYGDAAGRRLAREDGPCAPLGPYGASKLSQTLAALSFRHRGLDVAVARIFNTAGPGSPEHLVPGAFARQLALGARELRAGDLSPSRDFVDVRDIARALADLADPRVPGGVYNVCSGRAVKISEALRLLISFTGRPVEIQFDAARRGRSNLPHLAGDFSKLRRATGWAPKVSLEDSLRDTLAAAGN